MHLKEKFVADHRSTSRISSRLVIYVCCWLSLFNHAIAAVFGHRDPGLTQPRIRTLIGGEYWGDQLTPDYVEYLGQVKPDIIHAGVLGPELASVLADPGKLHAVTPLNLTNIPNIKAYQAFCH